MGWRRWINSLLLLNSEARGRAIDDVADVDSRDLRGQIALLKAVHNWQMDAVKYLTACRADVNAASRTSSTASMQETKSGNLTAENVRSQTNRTNPAVHSRG